MRPETPLSSGATRRQSLPECVNLQLLDKGLGRGKGKCEFDTNRHCVCQRKALDAREGNNAADQHTSHNGRGRSGICLAPERLEGGLSPT